MKRQCILLVLLLLLTLVFSCGCSSEDSASDDAAPLAVNETAVEEAGITENSSPAYDPESENPESEMMTEEILAEQEFKNAAENTENVTGVFHGLEDNHTAIFSFDGAESDFYFESEAVQNILYGAIMESSYTFSYRFDEALQLNVIYEISE